MHIKSGLTELDRVPIKIWTADSNSDPGIKHFVMLVANPKHENDDDLTSFICSCKGFQFRGQCWHIESAMEAD